MPYHDNDHAAVLPGKQGLPKHATTRVESPNLSRFSYDSLEESPMHDGSRPPATLSHKSKYWHWLPSCIWTTEILSCVIASFCLGAIVTTLCLHQGLPLPQWPLHITINALVSVFTAIFKMALTMPIAEGR